MATNSHIKFTPEVKGEVKEQSHKDWIVLYNVYFGAMLPVSGDRISGGRANTGKAQFMAISGGKNFDGASLLLYDASAKGMCFYKATIDIPRVVNDKQVVPVRIKLEKVYISGVDTMISGDSFSDGMQISYGAVKFTYEQFDGKGVSKGKTEFGWDIAIGERK
jgi:type VI secretion system secreted protein Hcp